MNHIHLIGFGSQGAAWAANLRESGWRVQVYLKALEGKSFERAREHGFEPSLVKDLAQAIKNDASPVKLVALLMPDHLIAPFYNEQLAMLDQELSLVLAHGYAVYAKELAPLKIQHQPALLAPKAIGPKLRAAFKNAAPKPHELVAAFHATASHSKLLESLAHGLGFAPENLVSATFEQEAIGDLISEQTLLCGTVFSFLQWTMEEMERAGVPARLIREECLSELELIAGLLRERGPASTFNAISQAAQCGTISLRERLDAINAREVVSAAAADVQSGAFAEYMRKSPWSQRAVRLKEELALWESKLGHNKGKTK